MAPCPSVVGSSEPSSPVHKRACPGKLPAPQTPSPRGPGPNSEDQGGDWQRNCRGDTTFVTAPDGSRPSWFWTGRHPSLGTPGVLSDGTITSLPLPNLATCTRQDALDYFDNTWCLTEVIFSALQGEEAFYRPPYHNLRHPFIFYYGHPAVLYVNKLRVAGVLTAPVNPQFEFIFETGVDEMSWDDLSKNSMEWPSVREVTEYRRTVYQLVRNVILAHPGFDTLPIQWTDACWAVFMGFEHERIHLETSSVLMRELPLRLLRKPKQWPAYHASVLPNAARAAADIPTNQLVQVSAGDVTIGKPHDWPSFGWDNEYGARTFHVRAFAASRFLISNGEFLQFVREGGYRNKALWSEEGWKWRTFRNAKWPAFWVLDGPAGLHRYKLRLCFEVVDMVAALPAVVNLHEARAYCNWLSQKQNLTGDAAYRLLTEPEHNRLRAVPRGADGRHSEDPVMQMSGAQLRGQANVNMAFGAECAVDAMEATPQGVHDVFGNVWQWCEDYFAALPASRGVHLLYDDFSTPCYDGEHSMIMGGAFVSTGDEASVFARFAFRPHFFQHAGFRIVSGTGPKQTSCMDSPPPHRGSWNPSTTHPTSTSDTQAVVDQQLMLHYGSPQRTLAGNSGLPAEWTAFPQRCVQQLLAAAQQLGIGAGSVLDVGCGVGGASFELARAFERVVGLDLDANAVSVAQGVQMAGRVSLSCQDEGAVCSSETVSVAADASQRARIAFKQMDPCCIAPDLAEFDAVVMLNLLERLPSPKGPLGRMAGPRGLVRPGGLLMVTSTYDWSHKVSDPQLWLGGYRDASGAVVDSAASLKAFLRDEFELVSEADMPLLLRRNQRKFEVQVSHATIWRRRAQQA
ncbi:hypothetical protein WJX72_007328 [[Myrmecia] bisecta]|uniref:Sulfatase-modifying factor enzyme-like domain-containing protein n=1 Tax=[Myrmecia] bisecta TaxID=41462 RepID=A0AAW1P6W4_9CHLO